MTLAVIIVAIAAGILGYMVMSNKYKPLSRKRENSQLSAYSAFKDFERKQKWMRHKDEAERWVERTFGKWLSTYSKAGLQYMIDRLNLENITAERLFAQRVLYAGVVLVISILFMFLSKVFGSIFLVAVYFAWNLPVADYKKLIERKNKNILKALFSYYSVLVSTYQLSYSTPLDEVTETFMKSTNDDMKEELSILVSNIQRRGVDYALLQLKKRVPLPYILRVCDTLLTRLTTRQDNISTMLYLKEELKQHRYSNQRELLKKKKNRSIAAQFSLVILLLFFSAMHMYFQSIGSVGVFFGK